MRNVISKVAIFTYTFILLVSSLLLLTITIQSENQATTNTSVILISDKTILPSGTRAIKVEYGQSFSIHRLFSITPDDRLNLTIHTSPYSTKKLGAATISVTFKKNKLTSNGLIRLTVVDTTDPVIQAQTITINQNDYFDPLTGVTVKDNVDQDLTNQVTITGTVATTIAGEYTLTYVAKDSSGNLAHLKRIVNVLKNSHEDISQSANSAATNPEATINSSSSSAKVPLETPVAVSERIDKQVATPDSFVTTNTMIIAGTAIPYENGGQDAGQSIIDSNINGIVSTWGGSSVQSGSDYMNTHFIGHNPGIFSILLSVGIGNQIVVTDASGQATTYTVNILLRVDDSGYDLATKTDYWDLIVGTDGGERIALQTCLTESENLVVLASK